MWSGEGQYCANFTRSQCCKKVLSRSWWTAILPPRSAHRGEQFFGALFRCAQAKALSDIAAQDVGQLHVELVQALSGTEVLTLQPPQRLQRQDMGRLQRCGTGSTPAPIPPPGARKQPSPPSPPTPHSQRGSPGWASGTGGAIFLGAVRSASSRSSGVTVMLSASVVSCCEVVTGAAPDAWTATVRGGMVKVPVRSAARVYSCCHWCVCEVVLSSAIGRCL